MDDDGVATEVGRDDMRRAAAELQRRTEALEASVEEERQALARARVLRDVLRERRDALVQQQQQEHDQATSELAAQQARYKEQNAENSKLKDALKAFLKDYYPPPSAATAAAADGDWEPDRRVKSLQAVLQMLMNKYANAATPAERYVRLDEGDIWAPYVELLLRSGVAEKHPTNSLLMRLSELW